jgi:hypothetical protein
MFIYPARNYNALGLLATPHNIKSSPLEQSALSLKSPPQPASPRVRKPVKILLPEQRVIIFFVPSMSLMGWLQLYGCFCADCIHWRYGEYTHSRVSPPRFPTPNSRYSSRTGVFLSQITEGTSSWTRLCVRRMSPETCSYSFRLTDTPASHDVTDYRTAETGLVSAHLTNGNSQCISRQRF